MNAFEEKLLPAVREFVGRGIAFRNQEFVDRFLRLCDALREYDAALAATGSGLGGHSSRDQLQPSPDSDSERDLPTPDEVRGILNPKRWAEQHPEGGK